MADANDKYHLLICIDCRTIDPLPYNPDLEHHDALQARLAEHQTPGGTQHRGHLADIDKATWDDSQKRKYVMDSIFESTKSEGFGSAAYYAVKATFAEDAMTCWKQHNRNRICPDYKSEKKLLQPGTAADRKSEKMQKYKSKTYLCDFCPVKSIVQQAHFETIGLYK